ncbi:MAG TPA: hypothetical protein VFG45_02745 [Candidatus Nitrosocosmicus sp.]|nr:hypothetical protein [Candidatus Nitrosocosmicus sp.]
MKNKSLVYTFVSLLILFISYGGFEALALPPDPNFGKPEECIIDEKDNEIFCCWYEPDILNPGDEVHWCQTCDNTDPPSNCGALGIKTDSPRGPASSLDDGVLQQPKESSPDNNNAFPNDGVVEEPKSLLQGNSKAPFNKGGVLKQ